MSYGPNPWQQTAWDWRAAGNFIGGGAGGGLIAFAALETALGNSSPIRFACGGVLIALGLSCVWLEIGRPLRALHVYLHPRRSWMSREAILAALLLPYSVAAAFGLPGAAPVAGVLGLAFVYAQARMLSASKGIPAWRAPRVVPLLVCTGLAEGGGLFLLSSLWHGNGSVALTVVAALLLVARWAWWRRYRGALDAAPGALAALDAAVPLLRWVGTAAPLVLIGAALALVLVGSGAIDAGVAGFAAALAGVGALLGGAWFKLVLVTRAGFNQGFALSRLPVRGVRRAATPRPDTAA
jgi:phenylacetyl-CoA:acceptor oxidoreductase subunit 2